MGSLPLFLGLLRLDRTLTLRQTVEVRISSITISSCLGQAVPISVNAFGDAPPGFSFRSFDALLVEGFNSTPVQVPEPSSALLGLLGVAMAFRRKRT